MKHTLGPWQINYPGHLVGNKQWNVANLYWGDDITSEEMHANARLIAAAPALLEAAHSALEALCGMEGFVQIKGQLRLSIALAEGGK